VGPAFGGLTTRATIPATGAVSGHETRSGWAVGTGLEYGISDNVTAKLEYLYVCFGESTEFAVDRVGFMSHYVRAAVNYKFDWGDRDYAARSAAALEAKAASSGYDWNGFYVGPMFGGSWSKLKADYTFGGTAVSGGSHFTDGGLRFGLHGLVGLQAGYNWQFGRYVLGLESDFQLSQLSGDTASTRVDVRSGAVTGTLQNTMNLPLSGTLRARAGFALDRWLFYATAGGTYGEFDKDSTFTTSTGGPSPQASIPPGSAGSRVSASKAPCGATGRRNSNIFTWISAPSATVSAASPPSARSRRTSISAAISSASPSTPGSIRAFSSEAATGLR